MFISVALRESDLAVYHDGAVPVTPAAFELSDLFTVCWIVDAQLAAIGILDI